MHQQVASVPILISNKRKSLTYHITKRQLKRSSLKNSSDFNSQILYTENHHDFNNIVGSISNIATKKPIYTTKQEETAKEGTEEGPPLKIIRYPTIKIYESLQEPPKRIARHCTEPSYSLSPLRANLPSQQKQAIWECSKSFKRYESPSNQRKLQLTRVLPHLSLKSPNNSQTAVPTTTDRLKPWQTRRDIFHETFKKYILQNNRKWANAAPL